MQFMDNNFIGDFTYGSQNYGLNYEKSDIDTITLVREAEKPRQEIVTPVGKTKIYTLKYFISRLKKGDLECYEILFTKFRNVNPIYENIFDNFVHEFSQVMNYNRIKYSLYMKLNEHMCHVLWLLKADGARYNKKRLYWAIRVYDQIQQLNNDTDFASSLIYNQENKEQLMKIKTETNYLSIKEFNKIYKDLSQFLLTYSKFNIEISDKEEKCLSDFYKEVNNDYK